jgi:hypothetical protein
MKTDWAACFCLVVGPLVQVMHARSHRTLQCACIHMHRSIASIVVGSDVILRRIFVETAVSPLPPVPAGMVTGGIPTG